jgi:hypothetical protein
VNTGRHFIQVLPIVTTFTLSPLLHSFHVHSLIFPCIDTAQIDVTFEINNFQWFSDVSIDENAEGETPRHFS